MSDAKDIAGAVVYLTEARNVTGEVLHVEGSRTMVNGEKMQENLVRTFLRSALEETGAKRGLLILPRNGEPRIAAEATRRYKSTVVRFRDEVADESRLPASVLHHVLHTGENVVIHDAARSTFGPDSYVRRHKVRSVLCLPLFNQNQLNQGKPNQAKIVGALLLESDSTSGGFTPTRIKTLKLVASLAGSALENSRLYGDLREREANMGCLVDANIIGIYVVDMRGPILESNDAYLHMLGYKREDLVSGRLRWTDLTPPEWHAADKLRVERVKRIGHVPPFEKEFFRKDGTRVPVLMGVARFKESRTQAVVFALDMSKQKRAEAIAVETCAIKQTRIARKLHDDLLQNFQGMMFQFQAARNLITRHPDEALLSLNEAIKEGQTALDESRNAIQDLRSSCEGKV
jgi:PAS domain S-box-containing protein